MESTDIYEGLVVHDGRQSGSITIGPTRLPLWALIADTMAGGAAGAVDAYELERGHELDEEKFKELVGGFLLNLTNVRGEFARLLLTIADVERIDNERGVHGVPWQDDPELVERVKAALQACLAEL